MSTLLFALNSSYGQTNLAVRCLKTAIDSAGYNCAVLERSLKDRRDAILHELYRAKAAYYGFSAYIWNIDELYRYAASLKTLLPDAVIVFGGPEVSFYDDNFFTDHPYIDYIIRGEGEEAWVSLLGNPSCGRVIDGAPYKNFTASGIHYDAAHGDSIVYYESSRGCPFRCAFCLSGISGGVRAKSAEKTLEDLLNFEKLGKVKIVKFVDRTFNFDRERAKTIWRGLLSDSFSLSYHFEICASLLDDESFEILSRFPKGKIQLEIGVQSTNPRTLAACGRSNDSIAAIAAAARIKSYENIHVHCDLIAGLPYENYDSFAKSFDDTYGCCDMLQLGFLKLLRGSALRENAAELGIVYDPAPPYTVLSTPDITYENLCKLHSVAAVLERYSGDGFTRVITYINKKIRSPFYFYEGLAGYIDSYSDNAGVTALSQNTARELFYRYASTYSVNSVLLFNEAILRAYMRFDWLLNEVRAVPDYLRSGFENADLCNEIMKNYSHRNPDGLFIPAAEAHMFEFDPEAIYIIDRKNRHYITVPTRSFS